MPGCGKSTLGRLLARRLGRMFLDTDRLIEAAAGMSLQDYMDRHGPVAFAALEESTALGLAPERPSVIATGGSMIYSGAAMAHLAALGPIIFLDVPLAELEQRVGSGRGRGLLQRGAGGLAALYEERRPLYLRHAGITVPLRRGSVEEQAALLERLLVS